MNKLDELIQELCPAGVEYKKIKEVYKRIKGTPITAAKMKEIADDNGDVKIFAGGKTIVYAFEKDIPNANITRIPAVLVQSRGVIDVVYYDLPFTFKNEMWAYTHENPITLKFLYYVLKNNINKFRDEAAGMGSMPQISLKVTEDFNMPIPPLEVQQEIVRLLDDFTAKTAELQAELNKEYEARKKQYVYYNKILLENDKSSPTKRLGDTCYMKSGKAIKASMLSSELDAEHAYPCYGGNGVRGYIGITSHSGEYPIIGRQGALCGNINYATGDFYATEHAVVVQSLGEYDQRYLYYLLTSMDLNQYKSQGAQPGLAVRKIENLFVPIPPLDKQKRIVSILDTFSKLSESLTLDLTVEIESRQKQYEYYRDKLLTFKELNESEVN